MARPLHVFKLARNAGALPIASFDPVTPSRLATWTLNGLTVPLHPSGLLGVQLAGELTNAPAAFRVGVGTDPTAFTGALSGTATITAAGKFRTGRLTVNTEGIFPSVGIAFLKVFAWYSAPAATPSTWVLSAAVSGDSIDRAPLPRVLLPEEANSGLGVDIACVTDVDRQFSLAGGLRNLGMALARRLITPRGGLYYDPDYGLDLRDHLNAGLTDDELGSLAAAVGLELEKDERVDRCAVDMSYDRARQSLRLKCLVTTAEPEDLTMVLQVSQVTATLLSVETRA